MLNLVINVTGICNLTFYKIQYENTRNDNLVTMMIVVTIVIILTF